jgi:hypothetical protein
MDPRTTRTTLAPIYERLSADGSEATAQLSPARRMGALLLALLVFAAMPMYWASTAFGGGIDAPVAPLTGKGGQPGSDYDEDDDRTDGARDTQGTDGAGDTRGTVNTDRGPNTRAGSATDGVDDTRGTDGRGDTRGTANTDRGPNTRVG